MAGTEGGRIDLKQYLADAGGLIAQANAVREGLSKIPGGYLVTSDEMVQLIQALGKARWLIDQALRRIDL